MGDNDLTVIFETRFSFFGQSGWKSQAAVDPGLLFDPDRIEARFRFFEMITLPSLVAQTDLGFEHVVLSSTLMPARYQLRLRELVKDTLGERRARVMFRPEGRAGRFLRDAVARSHGNRLVAQVVLDDDDAVACDFVETLRSLAPIAHRPLGGDEDYLFLSFARGLSLGFEAGRPAWLERRYVPYNNQALSLVAPATTQINPFLVSHRRVGDRHPSLLVTHNRPFHLRAVHDLNDSHAITQDKAMRPQDRTRAIELFPFLRRAFPAAAANPAGPRPARLIAS